MPTRTTISWTHTTLNPTVGCTKVSAGCDHCYAENLVNVRYRHAFRHPFEEVRLHLDRLRELRKLKPVDGKPHLVFVNSMSDFFHEQIPEAAIQTCLDEFERYPSIVFQILSKRPVRARQILSARYPKGVPPHIWIGASVEDNRVAARVNVLRRLRERVGSVVLFLSVEPIVGPTDQIDLEGINWLITGGESGPNARVMLRDWLMPVIENAARHDVPLWHKQNGQIRGHPNLDRAPRELGLAARFDWLQKHGWEELPGEKGGATIDRKTYRLLPPIYPLIGDAWL